MTSTETSTLHSNGTINLSYSIYDAFNDHYTVGHRNLHSVSQDLRVDLNEKQPCLSDTKGQTVYIDFEVPVD